MAKTYNSIPSVATGDVLTASAWNAQAQNVNGYRVPPTCSVYRSSDLTSYGSGTAIAWQAADYDTEGPSDPMWAVGDATKVYARTAGVYAITFRVYATATATLTLGQIDIGINGTTQVAHIVPVYSTTAIYAVAPYIYKMAAGDYITAAVGFFGGSAYVIKGSATNGISQTRLTVAWLGQAS